MSGVEKLADHLGGVEKAAEDDVTDELCKKLLMETIRRLQKQAVTDGPVLDRYHENGLNVCTAAKVTVASAAFLRTSPGEHERAVERLVENGWMRSMIVSRSKTKTDTMYSLHVGVPFGPPPEPAKRKR